MCVCSGFSKAVSVIASSDVYFYRSPASNFVARGAVAWRDMAYNQYFIAYQQKIRMDRCVILADFSPMLLAHAESLLIDARAFERSFCCQKLAASVLLAFLCVFVSTTSKCYAYKAIDKTGISAFLPKANNSLCVTTQSNLNKIFIPRNSQ